MKNQPPARRLASPLNRGAALALALAAFAASAAEVAGVKLDDKTQVQSKELVLNGAGLRKRVVFNVYVIGLYLPEKKSDPAAVLELAGPKRAAIHMLRDVSADTFTEALIEGLRENHIEADYKAFEPRVKELAGIFAEIKEAKKGMVITLDWTGSATQLTVNGKPAGKPIAGEDFYRALLRIWIGDKPVQNDLKKSLLGA
ncbi:MAG TPA: chalcone isomerase family protein [Burkholderiales bacterium]|nr:chalcone isomerase family protein [Burkholderiales bacterium]